MVGCESGCDGLILVMFASWFFACACACCGSVKKSFSLFSGIVVVVSTSSKFRVLTAPNLNATSQSDLGARTLSWSSSCIVMRWMPKLTCRNVRVINLQSSTGMMLRAMVFDAFIYYPIVAEFGGVIYFLNHFAGFDGSEILPN